MAFKMFNMYKRYKWRAQDFDDLQRSLAETARAVAHGIAALEIADGFGYVSAAGLAVTVEAGVAFGASGNVMIIDDQSVATLSSPAGNPAWSLVVVRPKLTNENYITRPTNPFDTVPLDVLHEAEVVVIPGTPAVSPAYPAKQANDVVLFGVKLASGAVSVATTNLDMVVRDRIGKTSDLGGLSPYDFIVGTSNKRHTHRTLAALFADPNFTAGKRVLVCDSETITSTLTVSVANIQMDFQPGVTLTNSAAGTGINVNSTGFKIRGARFSGFTTGISIADTKNYNMVLECRFATCTDDVTDNNTAPNNVIMGCITE